MSRVLARIRGAARLAGAAALLAAPALAQSTVTTAVGPPVAPAGCTFTLSFTNHTSAVLLTNLCPYQVFDAGGALVYTPDCFPIQIVVPPEGTFTARWDQTDGQGNPFPPGPYRIDFHVPELGVVSTPVEIHPAAKGAISTLGALEIGAQRDVQLCAPAFPGDTYLLMAAAVSTGGLPTCGGTIPLDFDPIFKIALAPGNGVFLNTLGLLDAQGATTAPEIAVPDLPALAGLGLILDFAVLDFQGACLFKAISEPLAVTVE